LPLPMKDLRLAAKTEGNTRRRSTGTALVAEPVDEVPEGLGHQRMEDMYIAHHRTRMFGAALAYTAVLVSALAMVWWQLRDYEETTAKTSAHSQYALWVTGLPTALVCPTPLHEHFEEGLGPGAVVGVSIGYEIGKEQDACNDAIDARILEVESHSEVKVAGVRTFGESDLVEEGPVEGTDSKEYRSCKWYRLDFVDWFIMGSASDKKPEPEPTVEERIEWVRKFQGSGRAVLVLSSEAAVQQALCAFAESVQPSWTTFKFEGEDYPLGLERNHNEPPSILWPHFRHQMTKTRMATEIIACMALLLAACCIYAGLMCLYIMYYRSLISVPGVEPSFVTDFLIGLLAVVGNVAVVCPAVEVITARAGFTSKDMRDATRMCLLFFGMMVLLVLDVWAAAVMAEQMLVHNAFNDSVEGPDVILAESVAAYVVPSYLYCGPFASVLSLVVLPYVLGSLLVRSRNVRRRDAERQLEPAEYDVVNRYGETITNMTFILVLGFFATKHYWQTLLHLAVYALLVLLVDKVVMLRYSSCTEYSTARLSNFFAYLWVVPSAGLAAMIGWWAFEAHYAKHWAGGALACIHAVAYLVMVNMLVIAAQRRQAKRGSDEKLAYSAMEETLRLRGGVRGACNYFNTNPVFCLRAWLLPPEESGWDRIRTAHQPSVKDNDVVPYVRGKAFLQPGTPHKVEGGLSRAWLFS